MRTTRLILAGAVVRFMIPVALAQAPSGKNGKMQALSLAYFVESAHNSLNALNGLLKKDSYRNKISSLNNPTSQELGFSLRTEMLAALEPILSKCRKTDTKKFREVIENFLSNPDENGLGAARKYLPSLGIFSTVLSLVGNLVIVEKSITREDLNRFIARMELYFSQYEKLNRLNEEFAENLQRLLNRCSQIRDDLKDFVLECVITLDHSTERSLAKTTSIELLIQRHYDPQKLQLRFDTARAHADSRPCPADAGTWVKLIAGSIRKLQQEFEQLYRRNHEGLLELLNSLETLPGIDKDQLARTRNDIGLLYQDSRQADQLNLNIQQVEERMHAACRYLVGSR